MGRCTRSPASMLRLLDKVSAHVPLVKIAGHFRNVYGMATLRVSADR
ncbi:hypothetical protein AKJ09_04445 [Labilithrix luteola]|uniref:Uncharacterized protein n=1 Tax=Labilithrix luteola TaxID=1391654 RepID=A0A0K1PWN1_9BACT|nr:hypothetical protein AKJ09_04445 [Labilithrix luteola]